VTKTATISTALSLGLALAATPAAAQDWRYCLTILKDGRGVESALLVGPVLEVAAVPDMKQAWTQFTRATAEAAMRQHGQSGSVTVNCSIGESLAATQSHRRRMLSIAQQRGLPYREIAWNPTPSSVRNEPRTLGDEGAQANDQREAKPSSGPGGAIPSNAEAKQLEPPRWIGAPDTPPPTGYSDWQTYARGWVYQGHSVPVRVDYAYRIFDNEIRVVWRCTNESSLDLACSVGGGKPKEYGCKRTGVDVGTTRSLGERASVRAGSAYAFPSDFACRGLNANGVSPHADIRWEG